MEAETECKVPGVYSETGIPVEDPAPGLNSDVSKKDAPPAVAAPGPGLYFEIGKKARDLLYKDFHTDQKFTLTTYTNNGVVSITDFRMLFTGGQSVRLMFVTMFPLGFLFVGWLVNLSGDQSVGFQFVIEDSLGFLLDEWVVITAASTMKDEAIFSEIQTKLKSNNVMLDVLTTITTEDLGVSGLKQIVSLPFPYQTAGKAELQYLHDYAGISLGVGLTSKPLVNLSGVFGNKSVAVGADVAVDTSTGDFTKYDAGLTINNSDLAADLTLNNKGDSLTASYYHLVNKESGTAAGAELTHSFSTKENTLSFGMQHALDPLTTVKARYNNHGMVSALIQHEWRPKSFLTLSAEVDTKAIDKASKDGIVPYQQLLMSSETKSG
ncbi:putative 36kDA porin II [Oryza sativa Japonica Group]|nr:putative 36kDA porin II [Oryza sativa Japonica Group]BAD87575.1 putative 36kDA porin II [Oryza sativa Japonica Group]